LVSKAAAELTGATNGKDSTNHSTTEAQAGDSPLRAQVDSALAGPPSASDKTKVNDRTTEVAQTSGEPDDPYSHTNTIKAITRDLDTIARMNKGPEDTIQVGDRQLKVKDVVTELKKTAEAELEKARAAAKSINQETVGVMLNGNIQDKNRLSRELGLDPAKVTRESLAAERLKTGSDPARRAKLDELDLNLQDRVEMEKLRHAPAYVKLVEAELVASGYNDPKLALGKEVSPEQTRKAFDLLKLAGNEDPDLKVSDVYQQAELSIGMTFAATQQQRSQTIINLMTAATNAEKTGQKQTVTVEGQTKQMSQEELLKEANRLADKINIGWLANQAGLQRNMENKTSEEMMNMIYVASHARLDYVNYMSNHGQVKEAQTLFNRVKTDTPELIYDEKGGYRDQSLERLDNKLTLGISSDGADYQTKQTQFLAALEQGNIYRDPKKPGQSAGEMLDQMKTLNQQARREMDEADKVLQADRQNLVKRQEEMQKRTLSDADKIELERVNREIKVIDNTLQQRHAFLARRENLTTYMEASYYDAREDYSKANSLYKQFQNNEKDPELQKQLDIEGKIGKTEPGFSGWWNRNWSYVAVGASIVVAAGLTVGTLGLGSAVGAGLVATALTATAVGTGGAALTHWGIERTVNKDAGWESAYKGAKIGFMTSTMIVAPWATGAKAAAAGTAAATGTEAAVATTTTVANASRIATMMNAAKNYGSIGANFAVTNAAKIGLTGKSLAVGYGTTAITQTTDVALGYKTAKEGAIEWAYMGALNSAFLGQASKWGVAKEGLTAANASKSALYSTLGYTKWNAVAGFGISGAREGYAAWNGEKDGGQAFGDFVKGGVINTTAISLARKFGGDTVGRYANANVQNLRYGLQAIGMQESIGASLDLGKQALLHDVGHKGVLLRDGGMSNTVPVIADTWNTFFPSGLNDRNKGEAQRIGRNADAMGDQFNNTVLVDQLFVRPSQINRSGVLFELDDIIKREQELQQQQQQYQLPQQ
jgi:hypothetical protein